MSATAIRDEASDVRNSAKQVECRIALASVLSPHIMLILQLFLATSATLVNLPSRAKLFWAILFISQFIDQIRISSKPKISCYKGISHSYNHHMNKNEIQGQDNVTMPFQC